MSGGERVPNAVGAIILARQQISRKWQPQEGSLESEEEGDKLALVRLHLAPRASINATDLATVDCGHLNVAAKGRRYINSNRSLLALGALRRGDRVALALVGSTSVRLARQLTDNSHFHTGNFTSFRRIVYTRLRQWSAFGGAACLCENATAEDSSRLHFLPLAIPSQWLRF